MSDRDWGELYRQLFPGVVRYLLRKVWDEERARELAQEVFVRALRVEPEEPRSWVFAVAANLARDEARTVLRRRKHLALLAAERSEDVEPDPSSAFEERERARELRVALETLSERDREVLLLWDAGLSYRDIAERSGLAAAAVGTTLSRARRKLTEAVAEATKRVSDAEEGGAAHS